MSDATPANPEPGALPTVAYIAGYGFSGSTLLDRLLGSHPAVFSAGELVQMVAKRDLDRRPCGCGRIAVDCPLWSRVLAAPGVVSSDHSPFDSPVSGNRDRVSRRKASKDRPHNRALISAIGQASGATVIVDSSKTSLRVASRPVDLSRSGIEVRLVHLIRDGRGAAWSRIKAAERRQSKLPSSLQRLMLVARSALGWSGANAVAWLAARRLRATSPMVITYEEMTANPADTASQLHSWLGLVPVAGDDLGAPPAESHQVGGNRMRTQPLAGITPDVGWKDNLGQLELAVFWLLAWPCALWHRRKVTRQRPGVVR